jgi:hypothetical protein
VSSPVSDGQISAIIAVVVNRTLSNVLLEKQVEVSGGRLHGPDEAQKELAALL